MNTFYRRAFLLLCSVLYFVLPYIGSRIRWKGTQFPDTPEGFPPGYGVFIDQKIVNPPPFNETIFTIFVLVAVLVTVFLLFPRLFGFKKANTARRAGVGTGSYPAWFLPSLIVFIVSWFLMWARWPSFLAEFSFVPLWWSFILLLDSLVYKRNGGKSILSTRPATLQLIFAVSSVAWFSFEYINFFFVELWVYPNNKLLTNFGNIFWYLLSFTVVWPGIFEFYTLLRTFQPLRERYANGPKIVFPKWVQLLLLLAGFVLAFYCGLYPRVLFWGIWLYPLLITAGALAVANYWTLFDPFKKGDWSLAVLIGLATLGNGFFYELWNYGSHYFTGLNDNPNFWYYTIPYLDKYYVFSEMPVIGYYGYILFGSIVWSIWLVIAAIFDFSPDFDPTD